MSGWLPPRWVVPANRTGVFAVYLFAAFLVTIVFSTSSQAAPPYSAMVVDGHTGKILYSRQGESLRYPASLTKIMTLYLLFDYMEDGKYDEDSRLTVSKNAAAQAPSKLGLKAGQTITVGDAIQALVTKSANDVAVVVAENIAGTEANFARLMTAKAKQIGMKRTVFKNASGLPNNEQVTTAKDMITMADRMMFDHPVKYSYFSQKYFAYNGKKYRNHNQLLFDYKGTDGIKTGYTRGSGFNLLANVRRGKKHLIAVVFGGQTSNKRNAAMRSLLNKSFPRAVTRAGRKRKLNPRNRTRPVQMVSRQSFPEGTARADIGLSKTDRAGKVDTVASLLRRSPMVDRSGGFHIQVGAYARKTDAIDRLEAIRDKAGDVIKGHAPLAMPLIEPQRYLYRARFAGFTRNSADETCNLLKKRAITCVVMAGD